MLEIQRVREIKGTVSLPTNPDFFLLSLFVALTSTTKLRIKPVNDTPLIIKWKELLSDQLDIKQEGTICSVSPKSDSTSSIILPSNDLPFRDFILFLLLGLEKKVVFEEISSRCIETWQKKAALFGYSIKSTNCDINGNRLKCLSLSSDQSLTIPEDNIGQNSLHACIGLAIGLKKRISFLIDYQFQSPLRHILEVMGYSLSVKSNREQKTGDPLVRRMRLILPRLRKKTESKLSFTVSIDFPSVSPDSVTLDIPGDDVLAAVLICAKSLIQKGQLVINNVPLEPWCSAALNFIHKMGCKTGIQINRQTSFGSAGMITFQKFHVTGCKMDCKPLFHFIRQLPVIVILSVFAKGRSVFRSLGDLHDETPDSIEQMLSCVRLLGGRHGEMLDGMVVEGAEKYDGFDLTDKLSASLSGACAVAGLKCNGKSYIEDSAILQRWPDFKKVLDSICEQRI